MRDYEEKSYYEIQLDNKQLILVFLSGLVLCVLIFVLGVMVGKGQKETEMAAMTMAHPEAQPARTEPDAKPPEPPKQNLQSEGKALPVSKATKKPAEKTAEPTAKHQAQAASAKEEYSFYDLDKKDSSTTDLEKPNTKTTKASSATKEDKEATSSESSEKSSGGLEYTVQVMATASRAKAEEQAASLRARGYKPFLDQFKTQGGVVYKVRVGKFTDSSDARQLANKLKQDMKLDTWVSPLD
jgi:cell division septation protein DedD